MSLENQHRVLRVGLDFKLAVTGRNGEVTGRNGEREIDGDGRGERMGRL